MIILFMFSDFGQYIRRHFTIIEVTLVFYFFMNLFNMGTQSSFAGKFFVTLVTWIFNLFMNTFHMLTKGGNIGKKPIARFTINI